MNSRHSIHGLLAVALLAAAGGGLLAGCQAVKAVGELGTDIAVATGAMTEEQGESAKRTLNAAVTAAETLTPENEYYIGRSVLAGLLGKTQDGRVRYPVYDKPALTDYVNTLGQALAMVSDRPETFGGYRFLVLDSDEINAFAAPGGLIVVTRGMIRCCRSEDALAAVLAHEIGHVQHQHGLKSIKKSRITGAVTTVLAEAGKTLGGADLAEAVKAFEGSLEDITQTLVVNGYGRAAEREADAAAVQILRRVGYDPHALADMLGQMSQRLTRGGLDFAKTHPDPADRIRELRGRLSETAAFAPPRARQDRFERMARGI
ncbi:MAG: M48 family metalloprotease [Kiritimatiellae bacterium]|nr:M48 family metalloprotease [Kiritimatiellia bacterium]